LTGVTSGKHRHTTGRALGSSGAVDIKNYYIRHGHVTFDTEETSLEQQRQWFAGYSSDGPHQVWVAASSEGILGYACSKPYRAHPAFDATVETSISLNPARRGQGLGTLLYTRLLEALNSQPVHLAVAGVALPNDASIALHRKMKFEMVGVFKEYATKRGARISSVWFQRLQLGAD
jgi:phosphinothricin acetyltransferase